jgi:hypothetical protein
MIDRKGLAARVKRLEQLLAGLKRELTQWHGGGGHPLTVLELRDYMRGIDDAIRFLEWARDTLAEALQRLDRR